MYITLKSFLSGFTREYDLSSYLKEGLVRTPNKLEPINEYMKRKNISMNDFLILWNEIDNRKEYLTRFYKMSLHVNEEKMYFNEIYQPMYLKDINNNTNPLLKNPIRNMYLKEILQKTESGLPNIPTYLNTVIDLFENKIIHYKHRLERWIEII